MRSFASDNNSGVHPLVMKALAEANDNHAVGYGDDPWTQKAIAKVKALFARESDAYLVFNGTGSNTMALQLLTRPYHIIFCAETAHISVDECGAPGKATGCFMRTITTPDGKLTPELLQPYMINFGVEHHSQPGAIYISQSTELGTVYTPDELRRLRDFADRYGLKIHIDGARIANAAEALGITLDEAAFGADTLTLGGTKNGLMGAECVVVFDEAARREAAYARKQSCQLASKMRFLAAQMDAYLTDQLWLECARNANRLARRLRDALLQLPYVQFTQKPETNQLFLIIPREKADRLHERYYFYFWNEAISEIRLVTSFDTTEQDIDDLIAFMHSL